MSEDGRDLGISSAVSGVRDGDLAALLVRVEGAEGADREIDGDLWLTLLCFPNHGRVFKPEFSPYLRYNRVGDEIPTIREDAPAYSASLDAALALCERVLPGYWWDLDCRGMAHVGPEYRPLNMPLAAWGKTPALALLAAMLNALMAQATIAKATGVSMGAVPDGATHAIRAAATQDAGLTP